MSLDSQSEGGMGPADQSGAVWRVSGDKVEWSLDTGPGPELSVPSPQSADGSPTVKT